MAGEGEKDQGTQGAGPGDGGTKKKIAGKFDTLEQAVEEGYLGLEKLVIANSEKVSALTKVIEAALTTDPGPPPMDQNRSRGGDSYGRVGSNDDDKINPAEFISDPGTYLRQRDERLMQDVVKIIGSAMAGKDAVDEFKRTNPDLIEHEKLVKAFMRDLDPRQSVSDRLEEAGKQVREYLAGVKSKLAGKHGRPPTGGDYVEEPRGGGVYGRPVLNSQAEEDEEAKALAEYITERQADFASHFGQMKKE